MSNQTIQFKIVTPERVVFTENVSQISLPTKEGEITVLPNHEPLIGIIEAGEVCFKKKNTGDSCFLMIADGFVEVDNNQVRVFVDTAHKLEELNEEAVLKAKAEAEEAMRKRSLISEQAFSSASAQLRRELAKLKFLKKHRKLGGGR